MQARSVPAWRPMQDSCRPRAERLALTLPESSRLSSDLRQGAYVNNTVSCSVFIHEPANILSHAQQGRRENELARFMHTSSGSAQFGGRLTSGLRSDERPTQGRNRPSPRKTSPQGSQPAGPGHPASRSERFRDATGSGASQKAARRLLVLWPVEKFISASLSRTTRETHTQTDAHASAHARRENENGKKSKHTIRIHRRHTRNWSRACRHCMAPASGS